jgi:hypothetical protein
MQTWGKGKGNMTLFDDKEKAAENKYAHDKELEFKVHARAHKLLGLWAAEKMGKGAQAQEYANSLITENISKTALHSLVERIKNDLLIHEIDLTDHALRQELYRFEQQARREIAGK